jgi:hypothetical protein
LPDLVREGSDTDEARNGGVSLRAQQGRGAEQERGRAPAALRWRKEDTLTRAKRNKEKDGQIFLRWHMEKPE